MNQLEQNAQMLRTLLGIESDGRTGKINPATGKVYDDPCVGLDNRNKIWMRFESVGANDAPRGEIPVWNYGRVKTNKANIPVVCKFDNKTQEWYVDRASTTPANEQLGSAGQYFYGPDAPPATLNDADIGIRNIQQFRARTDVELGGLYLWVEAGWYNGSYWPGGRILLVPTATASKKAHVVVGFDEVTGALVQALGSDYSLAMNPLPASDITTTWADSTFANARPIAAVPLANGATGFSNSAIVDIRDLTAAGAAGAGGFDADSIMVDADGSIMVDADGNVMVEV